MSEPGHGSRGEDPDRFARLFTGIQAQAEADAALDDLAEAEALAVAEIARIAWADRLRAAGWGRIELPDGSAVSGAVEAVLVDGVHLSEGGTQWVIRTEAVRALYGLGERITPASLVEQRLTVTSILRRWLEEACEVHCRSAHRSRDGTLVRVGVDHIDLLEHIDLVEPARARPDDGEAHDGVRVTVPLSGVWVIRRSG